MSQRATDDAKSLHRSRNEGSIADGVKSLPSGRYLALIAVLAVVIASFWNSVYALPDMWENPEYSHGYLIPLFSFVLLWHRRPVLRSGAAGNQQGVVPDDPLPQGWYSLVLWLQRQAARSPVDMLAVVLVGIATLLVVTATALGLSLDFRDTYINLAATVLAVTGCMLLVRPTWSAAAVRGRWWGLAVLCVAVSIRLVGAWHFATSPDFYAFVLATAGIILLVGGWPAIKWAWPSVAVLLLTIPFPDAVRGALIEPLQQAATQASTYCLQTLGLAAFSEGNTIKIGELQMSVVEACSGLRMLTVFGALSIVIALFLDRPIWERCVVALSAVPIALCVNIVRITVTGVLYQLSQSDFTLFGMTVTKEFADHLFHNWAGYFMMPLALVLLFLELQIFEHLFLEPEEAKIISPIALGPRRAERQPVSAGS